MNSKLLWLWVVVIGIGAFFAIERLVSAPAPAPLPVSDDLATLPAGRQASTWEATTHPDIIVTSPQAGDTIKSPLVVTGEARGSWYFEASFPVILVDWDGLIIAEVPAQAIGNWMTTDFVPFRVEIPFTKPAYGKRGALILKKDNPSGLPENDAAVEIPIVFE